MHLNKCVYINLIKIRNANRALKIFTDITYNKLMLYIINFLYMKGYIFGYTYISKRKMRIYLKYVADKGLLSGLNFYLRKSYFSYKALKHLSNTSIYNVNHLYVFSTLKGFLTLEEIFLKNLTIGGILYFYIVF